MSQLIDRLEKARQETNDPVIKAELLARCGCYLARIGCFDETKQIVAELRRDFGGGISARISTWIMLLEGVLHIFENISPAALDRINRAQFLALAIKDRVLSAVTSAWKAHIEFETSDFTSMVRSLGLAIENATDDNHDAHARLSMVLADSFFLCGDRLRAQQWFMRSRSHALDAGDQATIEALLYNRAAFGMAWLRAQSCLAATDRDELALTRLEIASARNFQDMTRITALSHLIRLCEARLLLLEGSYGKAIDELRTVRDLGPFAKYNFDRHLVDLELVYCLFRTTKYDDALALFDPIRENVFENLDVDERLVAAWLRKELSYADDRFGNAHQTHQQFVKLRQEFELSRKSLHEALMIFGDPAPLVPMVVE